MTRQLSTVLCAVVLALTAGLVLAKRIAPKPVEPVVADGVKYVAPNANGRKGVVEARGAKTDEMLWTTVVYTVPIDPNLEEDVQWVFITKLEIRDGTLRVTDEEKRVYVLDPKTGKVIKKDDAAG